jgi:hypothetical protein
MKDTRELANHILADLSEINPYTAQDKHLAFTWATGFLARVLAEIIWRDSGNWEIYTRIRNRVLAQKGGPAA